MTFHSISGSEALDKPSRRGTGIIEITGGTSTRWLWWLLAVGFVGLMLIAGLVRP